MDPPVYGHGPQGETWNFDSDFPELISSSISLLSLKPLFILISAYATTNSAITLKNVLSDLVKELKGEIEEGELAISQKDSDRLLPAGIFAKWSASS